MADKNPDKIKEYIPYATIGEVAIDNTLTYYEKLKHENKDMMNFLKGKKKRRNKYK